MSASTHAQLPDPQLIAGRYRCTAEEFATVSWSDEHDPGREPTLLDLLTDPHVSPNDAISVHLDALGAVLPGIGDWATTMEDHARAHLAGKTPTSGVELPADELALAIAFYLTELYRVCEELGELLLGTLHPGPGGGCFAPRGVWRECTCAFSMDLDASDLDPAARAEVTRQLSHALTVKGHVSDAAFWMGQADRR